MTVSITKYDILITLSPEIVDIPESYIWQLNCIKMVKEGKMSNTLNRRHFIQSRLLNSGFIVGS